MPAVIFDLDGTLVDLFELHYRAFADIIWEDYGLVFERNDLEPHYGKSGEEIAKSFFEKRGIAGVDYGKFADKRRKRVMDNLKSCVVMPGAKKLLDSLRAAGIDVAIGTSNPPEVGEAIISACGLEGYFTFKSYRMSGMSGKPAPDIFFAAASGLGLRPSECVVVEDSIHGIAAAKRAGMKAVAVATGTHSKEELAREGPDLLVGTLEELNRQKILKLFNGKGR